MSAPARPLPESLTRLLTEPATRSVAPTPGDRRRGQPSSDERLMPGPTLETAVLRGFVYLVSGMVWGTIVWSVVRHLMS